VTRTESIEAPEGYGASQRTRSLSAQARCLAFGVLLLARAAESPAGPSVTAPSPSPWSTPLAVTEADAPLVEPILLSDSSGAVHLFFAAEASGPGRRPSVLRHARWADGHWSKRRTALAWVVKGAIMNPALTLDERGWLHAVYAGRQWGRLEYRRVHLSELSDRDAWTDPEILSTSGVLHSAVTSGPGRRVFVVYASFAHQVFFHASDDGGRTWTEPRRLSDVDPKQEACDDPRIAIDARGRLHALWTQYRLPKAWPPTGTYYRISTDGGLTWGAVRQVSGLGTARINIVTRGSDELHLVWNDAENRQRMHQWSGDGGATWSVAAPIAGVAGASTRALSLAFDQAGTLHLITSVGGPGGVEPVVHATWRSDRAAWSAPEGVSGGMVGAKSAGSPALAIEGGNTLHVAYKGSDKRIWSTDSRTDAPAIAARPVPTRPTDLRTRLEETSTPLRVLVGVLAIMGIEALVSGLRHRRRAAH
jgi:BNR repeat-like domain